MGCFKSKPEYHSINNAGNKANYGATPKTVIIPPVSTKANVHQQDDQKKIPCWLSCELRLDDFDIKNQMFSVSGWYEHIYHLYGTFELKQLHLAN